MDYKNDEKILLILDLDETLIHATKEQLEREADFKIFDYYVYQRPFLAEFLRAVANDFLLAIWSSASDDYVQEIVERIIPSDLHLEFVWGRSRCTYRRNFQMDEYRNFGNNTTHYHYVKPLKKVKRRGYNLKRILIVDDSPHKSKDNYGNAIYSTEFTGDINDEELKLLIEYLKQLKDEENVRHIEKRGWQLH